ncbi:rhodanese-like domain-containing protein [Tropicimonas sp. IMCC6043]|uniref:rhodanese-like domain-containing protein n=1 Tax=Tropicimonas sp. IMCC6043 TaxID=2510645 RepID=UPI00101E0FA4|nr:rhodanese-like domain-containing protein [Tropicimonas sp. IMCC6043]RYH12147.1 rhodanese-like domain-containing protein [Tropicimonas sp. IMCC6043]
MPGLKVTSAEMVARARARISEISAGEATGLVGDPEVVFVDLRDLRERQRLGFIPGAFHCPRGMLEFWVDPESRYFKDVFGQQKRFVFYCASGWRSALSVAVLDDMGFPAEHIREGFTGWVEQGGPVAFPEPRAAR